MLKRYGRKSDSNQTVIMRAMRDVGAVVFDIEEPFDLLVDWRGRWLVLELKNPETHARKKGGSKLTDTQEQILERLSASVHIVETAKEAIDVLAKEGRKGGNAS